MCEGADCLDEDYLLIYLPSAVYESTPIIDAYAISISRTEINAKLAPKTKENATSQTFIIFSCCSSWYCSM